ncbi:3-isopropylmalate dehydratase small subunit [Sphingomonas sp. CGMCC 1.13654]|uniref:3-isopropylmalate dehydratase small subunit n=1 Tax=Sphingomonas chungangi TaxID=2683589 RepID=A0A838L7B8_9SPHN|nr:3-isopropylmalate dehydratase small subunit [Sphingomonas chungangi]MBA2934820.1 3-isopropylmalate dehydratase small subunit [Sphingomonas chungangi]MVW58131.1 3-isopropylmalate dehydratase small subunit [Sphingomonas chungangi]
MTPFTTFTAVSASLPDADVDTDIIYPARFLLITEKKGLGRYAFYEKRFDPAGAERPDFLLNRKPFREAGIIVAGANFGCGSSREQAPWALADLGIRCIIAPSFGEIFFGNCFKNGMLPIVLDGEPLARLRADAEAGAMLTVDLDTCLVIRPTGDPIAFTVDPWRREALLNGWDEVSTILARRSDDIAAFERHQQLARPWLWQRDAQENDAHG